MFLTMKEIVKVPEERDPEKEWKAVRFFEDRIRNEAPSFRPELFDAEEYHKILVWVAQYGLHLNSKYRGREFIYPKPEKGLLINGRTGRGKSTVAGLISSLFRTMEHDDRIPFYSLAEIDKTWGTRPKDCESDFPAAFNLAQPVIIDDVGAEGMMKHFGNEPVVTFLMQHLYNAWKYRGKLAILTSNLSTYDAPEAAKDTRTFLGVYGERVSSRIHEMFEIVRINGNDDLRKIEQTENRSQLRPSAVED